MVYVSVMFVKFVMLHCWLFNDFIRDILADVSLFCLPTTALLHLLLKDISSAF